nr:LysR substrate-binding domain-containing protein [uncultured Holophaga sp.]
MFRPNLSLAQLRYFLAVADCLSYTEAARRLHISQPPLSKQISLLEAELGFPLFRRGHRGVTLTPAGAALSEEVRGLFQLLEHSVTRVRQLAVGGGCQIRLAIPEAMVLDPLQQAIRHYQESHAGVDFHVSRLPMGQTREALLVSAVDLLFTLSFELSSLPGCESLSLGEREGRWVLARSHPLAAGGRLDLGCSGLPLVRVREGGSPGGLAWLDRACELEGYHPHEVVEVSSWEALLTQVELGRGVALVGRPLAERNAGRFAAFEPGPLVPRVGLVLVWRRDSANPALPGFLAWLEAQA